MAELKDNMNLAEGMCRDHSKLDLVVSKTGDLKEGDKKPARSLTLGVRVLNKEEMEQMVAGALFDFLGFLTTLPGSINMGECENATPAMDCLTEWARRRNLSLKEADVHNWSHSLGIRESITRKCCLGISCGPVFKDQSLEEKILPRFPAGEEPLRFDTQEYPLENRKPVLQQMVISPDATQGDKPIDSSF